MTSNVGKWDNWYRELGTTPSAFRYSETETYKIAAKFLADCETIEDWGVGGGGFLNHCKRAIGVDGSNTPFAAKKYIDLCNYKTSCEGIHLRHVLEHNYEWEKILINALKSATKKIVITFFIPLNDGDTIELAHNLEFGVDVPDLSISKNKFDSIISKYNIYNIDVDIVETNLVDNLMIEIVCKITI